MEYRKNKSRGMRMAAVFLVIILAFSIGGHALAVITNGDAVSLT